MAKTVTIRFTKSELIHLRRFLTRSVECAEGRCRDYQNWSPLSGAWYYVRPLLEKVNAAHRRIKQK